MTSVARTGVPDLPEHAPDPRARRRVGVGALYSLLVVICVCGGYWYMFSRFSPYDDEGFFDYTLKLFTDGHPMYTAVFSDYGPFYYLIFRGLFTITGRTVTMDAGRLIQLAVWIASSAGLGVAAHRLTGRLTLGVTALAASFALMTTLAAEPMHAEALICLMLTASMLVIAFGMQAAPRGSIALLGVLAAFLLLTKINVGGYAIVAIVFAGVMAGRSLRRHTSVRALTAAAFVLVGPAVMVRTLNTQWTLTYACLAVLSALALVFVATPTAESGSADESRRWPVWFLSGFTVASGVVLAILFILGSSPLALFNQVVLVPSHQATALTIPAPLGGKVIWWGLVAVVIAWSLRQAGRTQASNAVPLPNVASGLLRGFAGLAILLSLVDQFPFAISPTAPFGLAMPLAWVAALPSARDSAGPRARLIRLLIPSMAILQALLAYPVAGSQMALGSILLVLCGVICLDDAATELLACSRRHGARGGFAASTVSGLLLALSIGAVFQLIIQPVQGHRDDYRAGTTLAIAGATHVRLPAPTAAVYNQIVALVRTHCRTLATLPGMYSFNIWSRLPAPSPLTGQPFWHLLDDRQQQQVLTAARRSPGLCLIRNDAVAASYQHGGAPPVVPLVAFYDDDFTVLARIGPYAVETRRAA